MDDKIADICQLEKRAIVTPDLDFADIRVYPPEDYDGLIVLRLGRQDKPHVLEVFVRVVEKLQGEDFLMDGRKTKAQERLKLVSGCQYSALFSSSAVSWYIT